MGIGYFWFLSIGVTRVYAPRGRKRSKGVAGKLCEPQASSACRRNILVLSGTLVVAGLAGVEPKDIVLFGMKPSKDSGVIIFGTAAVLAHLYWYCMRYQHLKEAGEIEQVPAMEGESRMRLKIAWNRFSMERKGADLVANWAALLLTAMAWAFVCSWVLDAWPR